MGHVDAIGLEPVARAWNAWKCVIQIDLPDAARWRDEIVNVIVIGRACGVWGVPGLGGSRRR
jgi:hypothetical protein